MCAITVTLLLATVLYVADAEKSFIDPKNYFYNDEHCVDIKCADDQWEKGFKDTTNLDEMQVCVKTANDDKLKQLYDNFMIVFKDTQSYLSHAKDDAKCKQNAYRTLYMYKNVMWYRRNLMKDYVEKNMPNVQACFKQPMDEAIKRTDNINSCWKKAGDKKCDEKEDGGGGGGGGGGGNSGGDSKDDDKSSGSKEDDEDNTVCGEQQDVSNANMTCIQSYWKSINFGETPPIMEKCVGQISGNTNELKKNIDEYAACIESTKKCYEYSETKNYQEMNTRLGKVQEMEEEIKKKVNKLPEPNQACFKPAFEKVESHFQANNACMNQ